MRNKNYLIDTDITLPQVAIFIGGVIVGIGICLIIIGIYRANL